MKRLELFLVSMVLITTVGFLTATTAQEQNQPDSLDMIDNTLLKPQTSNEVESLNSQHTTHPLAVGPTDVQMDFQELPSEVQKMLETTKADSFNFQKSIVRDVKTLSFNQLVTRKERISSRSPSLSVKDEGKPDSNKEWVLNQIVEHRTSSRLIRESDGSLDFGELPTRPGIQSVLDYPDDAIQTFYNFVRLFVDTVLPGPLPYGELIVVDPYNITLTLYHISFFQCCISESLILIRY